MGHSTASLAEVGAQVDAIILSHASQLCCAELPLVVAGPFNLGVYTKYMHRIPPCLIPGSDFFGMNTRGSPEIIESIRLGAESLQQLTQWRDNNLDIYNQQVAALEKKKRKHA